MGIKLDGLASGFDSTSFITSLMQLEAIPQTLIKNKATKTQTAVTALQGLNSKIASLATLATTTAKPGALAQYTAASSSTAVKATAGAGTGTGAIDLVVGKLAKAHSSVSDATTSWPSGSLTIDGSNGPVTVTADSLDALVTAINGADAGVQALKVSAGKDGLGANLYRLQFTATETGAGGAFTVSGLTTTTITQAQDAEVTLWAGTAAAQTITSSTNTFSELLPGVAVTVSAASVDPVTLTVARDSAAVTTVAKNFVSALTDAFAYIDTKSTVTNSKDSSGNAIVSGGVFTGDSTVRSAKQTLLSAVTMPVNGHSPSDIGITITKTGTIEFDATKFASALAADPAKVESAMTALAERVASAATIVSDKTTGTLTAKVTGQETLVKDLNNQADSWDLRLEKRLATLERTYSALEVRMSALNSQSTWLSSQIASLPTYGGNKS